MSSLFERGLGANGLIQRMWDAAGEGDVAADDDGIIERVTLYTRAPGDTWVSPPTSDVVAFRRVLDLRDQRVQNGLIPAGTLAFHLRVSTLAGVVPRQHDKITDADGVTWFIDFVRLETANSRYRCEVLKAVS